MLQYDLPVEKREKGKHILTLLRKNNKIPCVAYGHKEENRLFSVDEVELNKMFHAIGREKSLINIKMGKDNFLAIIKEIFRSPRTNRILHIDFQIIHKSEKLKLTVPIILKGSAKGVKEGGIVEHLLRDLEIKCLPADIPSHVEVDISELAIGDSIHVKDIKAEKFEIVENPEEVVVTILAPKAYVEEAPKPEEEAKEPELIREKKEEGEEEEEKEDKGKEKEKEKKEKK
ncbi:MAG: 50S ribosomal protein L25 [candidate division WOR-3 bacterium]